MFDLAATILARQGLLRLINNYVSTSSYLHISSV